MGCTYIKWKNSIVKIVFSFVRCRADWLGGGTLKGLGFKDVQVYSIEGENCKNSVVICWDLKVGIWKI